MAKDNSIKMRTDNFNAFYGAKHALQNVTTEIQANKVIAFIGPSGCGKSTFLRSMNRMNDLIDGFHIGGTIEIDGLNIYEADIDVVQLRNRVGMVFPKSIYENVAFGLRLTGKRPKLEMDGIIEQSLKRSALWDEVKDRLEDSAMGLSGGQQQRLCIARAIAVNPEILLMDEPCSALDPISTAKIEELISELKNDYTIVIVTHNMQQAARVSDFTGFFYMGNMVEFDRTRTIFTSPSKKETEDYITGRFG